MRIYTRTGDGGETGLFSGKRVGKDDLRVEAYGAVDEVNNYIGLLRAESLPEEVDRTLADIQRDLFTVGADLATPADGRKADRVARIGADHVQKLEKAIDELDGQLPPLRHFVLPAGPRAAALAHVARGVARTAERRVVALSRVETVTPGVLHYLNRLSDLLFVVARFVTNKMGLRDEPWHPEAPDPPPSSSAN